MPNIGRYRIVRRIGKGGMAEVLEAIAEGASGFERRVAIKRMMASDSDGDALARMFLDEARIASKLHHGNIVAILDYGVADGLPFQVLELVDGADTMELSERADLLGAPMPVEVALHICTEIAHALAYAHDAVDDRGQPLGIVHRDVKPANILVSWSGDILLADFGIAFARQRVETTSAGVAKGTVPYMPPEQATGGTVDRRSDLFALGCVLHRLLCGKSPLSGESSMMDLLTGTDLELDSELPEDVRAVVERAVRRSKKDRYQTADEMGADLGAALARRLEQDPKTTTREWLAKVRPSPAATAPASRLDDLFDVELVLAGDDDGVRSFTTQYHTAAERPAAKRGDGTDRDGTEVVAGRGSRAGMIAGLALVGLAVAGLWWMRTGSGAPASPRVALVTADAGPVAAPLPDQPFAADAGAPIAESALDAGNRPASRVRNRRRPDAARAERATPPEREPDREPAVSVGFVSIGGGGAHRAEIFVDGRSRGYAPKRLELSEGSHSIELVTADGRRIGPRTVRVTERHTRGSPFRWIIPDE